MRPPQVFRPSKCLSYILALNHFLVFAQGPTLKSERTTNNFDFGAPPGTYEGWLSDHHGVADGCSHYVLSDCEGNFVTSIGEESFCAFAPFVGRYISVMTEILVCGYSVGGEGLLGPVAVHIELVENPCGVSDAAPTPAPMLPPIELALSLEHGGDGFGYAVAGIPDVDGDGYGDVVVGEEDGVAYVFSGSTGICLRALEGSSGGYRKAVAGISDVDGDGRGDVVVGVIRSVGRTGFASVHSGATGHRLHSLSSPNDEGAFGWAVSGIPDVDGDDCQDILVGDARGHAFIFSGASGADIRTLVAPEGILTFGETVAGVPDVDGDGLGDAVVGAHRLGPIEGAEEAGRAYIFSGSTGKLIHVLISPNEERSGRFGWAVSGLPDVDGDGRGEVVVAAKSESPNESPHRAGRVYVFSGATGQLLYTLVSPSEEFQGRFGSAVAAVPDVNGDGWPDVVVGSEEDPPPSFCSAGHAYVFSGADGELLFSLYSPNDQVAGAFGWSVGGIPDVDGDGLGDVVVGARNESPGDSEDGAGRAYIFRRVLSTIQSEAGSIVWDVHRSFRTLCMFKRRYIEYSFF